MLLAKLNPKSGIGCGLFLLLCGLLISLAIFMTSCSVSEKQRREICATCPIHDFHDSSTKITERIIHDTLRLPGLPGPIQYLANPCSWLCDSAGKLKPVDIQADKNGIKTHIKTSGNTLLFTAEKDSAKVPITEKEITISSNSETKATIVIHDPCLNERTWVDKIGHWCIGAILLEIIALIIYIVIRIYKPRKM